LVAVGGANVFLQAGQDLRIGGRQSNAEYQYTIQSDNLDDLVKWGPIVLQRMKQLPGFTEVNSDQQNNGLRVALVYDRATASGIGAGNRFGTEAPARHFDRRGIDVQPDADAVYNASRLSLYGPPEPVVAARP
jgi:hypothetical protein